MKEASDGGAPKIGVAVSGGGHRATAWALGVFAALVDTQVADGDGPETHANSHVLSISSVSGGSIANGVVANNIDFSTVDASEFLAAVTPALKMLAVGGLFFNGHPTDRYLRGTFSLLGLTVSGLIAVLAGLASAGRDLALVWFAALGLVLGLYVGYKVGTLLAWWWVAVMVGFGAATAFMCWGAAAVVRPLDGWAIAGGMALLVIIWFVLANLALQKFSDRGLRVRAALERTLLARPGGTEATKLADVHAKVNHVFCTTDLQSGIHFYLAPAFVYGYREGISESAPSDLTLATAVQASAGFPGGFPPTKLTIEGFEDPQVDTPEFSATRDVFLSDGGVYDNMGDEWESALVRRQSVCPAFKRIQAQAADVIVVANASRMWTWTDFGSFGRLKREITALLRVEDVQYNVTTSRRRLQLVDRWSPRGEVTPGHGGIVVMIDHEPKRLADPFVNSPDAAVSGRAQEAVAYLNTFPLGHFERLVTSNPAIPTTLGPIGREPALDLMEHAYTSTVVGLYVLHDIGKTHDGLLPKFDRSKYGDAIGAERVGSK